MDAMLRRRGMMALGGSSPLPEWDVVWDAANQELPTAQGFTDAGDATVTLQTVSIKVHARSDHSRQYLYPSNAQIGVLEAKVKMVGSQGYCNIYFGNGVTCPGVRVQYSSNYKGIYLLDNSDQASRTKLLTTNQSDAYTIKVVHKATTADIYVDDVLKSEDVPLTDFAFSYDRRGIYIQGSSSSAYSDIYLYSMKLKLGRIS